MSEIKLSAIEKTSLIFGEKISSMIINNIPHSEISEEINSERNSNIEYNWELIGDHIVSINGRSIDGVTPAPDSYTHQTLPTSDLV